ncbi:sulfite exporter TauE/SafE family protein [Stackebrandtia soli]|uniref:sulfite exporter TauE/SafE family protein n=1 Tax=Stackebrandtia soli TaxID=1892856 RepID=UPI0039EC91E0
MDVTSVVLLLTAGLAAGAINSLAGGGSLVTYPALVTVGLPPVTANVTNSIAVFPGYVSSVVGSRRDLPGQGRIALTMTVPAVIGAIGGTILLLSTPAAAFEAIVPFLVIGAALLLAFQQRLRALVGHPQSRSPRRQWWSVHIMTGIGALYGGYFGAALGVMLVAGLALVRDDRLARISALKNVASATVGAVTVLVYGIFAPVNWLGVAVLAPATVVGGYLGARLARWLPQNVLRGFIVVYGLAAGVYLLLK